MKKNITIIVALILFLLAGCSSPSPAYKSSNRETTPKPTGITLKDNRVYENNEQAIVQLGNNDLYGITIKVTKTDKRNKYTDKNPEEVIILEYTYENISSSEDICFYRSNFKVTDSNDTVCDVYPLDIGSYIMYEAGIGEKQTVCQPFGLANKSDRIQIEFSDENLGVKILYNINF